MKRTYGFMGSVAAIILITPLLAAAQTDSNAAVSAQVQSLLSQISTLEQQLHTLIQSVAPSSTAQMWMNASSTSQGLSGTVIGRAVNDVMTGNCPSFERDLSIGSQGNDVMQLQQFLSGSGFFSASTTGYFGPLTASALNKFQLQFGISSSSVGSLGPLTRSFIGLHCGGQNAQNSGQNGGTGPSKPQMWQGTSTPPMHPNMPSWMGTSTDPNWEPGMMGSSTSPRPCPQNSSNADQGAAAALFVPHVILPAFLMNPCGGPQGENQQGQGGSPMDQ